MSIDLAALSLHLRGLTEEITNNKIDRIVMAGMNILFAKNAFFGVYNRFFGKYGYIIGHFVKLFSKLIYDVFGWRCGKEHGEILTTLDPGEGLEFCGLVPIRASGRK